MADLLPCPLCGSAPEHDIGGGMECNARQWATHSLLCRGERCWHEVQIETDMDHPVTTAALRGVLEVAWNAVAAAMTKTEEKANG